VATGADEQIYLEKYLEKKHKEFFETVSRISSLLTYQSTYLSVYLLISLLTYQST